MKRIICVGFCYFFLTQALFANPLLGAAAVGGALLSNGVGSNLNQNGGPPAAPSDSTVEHSSNWVRCSTTIWVTTSFPLTFYPENDQEHALGNYNPMAFQRKFTHEDICINNKYIYAVTGNNMGPTLSNKSYRSKLKFDNRTGQTYDEESGNMVNVDNGQAIFLRFPDDFVIDPDELAQLNSQPLTICNLTLRVNSSDPDLQNGNSASSMFFYAANQLVGTYLPTSAQRLFIHHDICVNNQAIYGIANGRTYKSKATYNNMPIDNGDGTSTPGVVSFVQFPEDFVVT